ncbi:thioredoxin-like protein [Dipodascopsis tothii]|uniref:thioredoxin-like protein n=1 Tax=Dipodascopsis tothii TaxID=44089 RepID=UPI0034CDCD97
MDRITATVFEKYTDQLVGSAALSDNESIKDDDEFLDLIDEDDAALQSIRERRMQELQTQMTAARRRADSGHGQLSEVKTEKEVLSISTSTKLTVLLFFHADFKRCEIMQRKLSDLASKHLETRFISVNVENAPFLVTKLNVKVLPCVLGFVDGMECMRLVGFEKLGNTDAFDVRALENQLRKCKLIERYAVDIQKGSLGTKGGSYDDADSEDDWDV